MGRPIEDWQALNLLAIRGVLQVNGEMVGEGKGADALGNPLAAVVWLVDQLAAQGKTMKRDMIVMPGSIVTAYFPKPGERGDHFLLYSIVHFNSCSGLLLEKSEL